MLQNLKKPLNNVTGFCPVFNLKFVFFSVLSSFCEDFKRSTTEDGFSTQRFMNINEPQSRERLTATTIHSFIKNVCAC